MQMGCRCIVNTNVLVGNKDSISSLPIIGNNVELAVGSMVIGKLVVGNNSRVAPNAVVTKDVPENALVGGVPAKIIKYIDNVSNSQQ